MNSISPGAFSDNTFYTYDTINEFNKRNLIYSCRSFYGIYVKDVLCI